MHDDTAERAGELLNLGTNCPLGMQLEAGAAVQGRSKINPLYTYRNFTQQWADTAEQREQYTQNSKKILLGTCGWHSHFITDNECNDKA